MSNSTEAKQEKQAEMKTTGEEENDQTESASVASAEKTVAKKESKYHRGKWTNEECEYMLGLMEAFKAGHLPLREGTTLRSFLSSMMKCKPKRISKKFEGISYNGRMVYHRSKDPITLEQAMLLRARLSELERRYLVAAAEQRDDKDTIEALLSQGAARGPELSAMAAFAVPSEEPSLMSTPLNMRTMARLPQRGLGSELPVGLGALRDDNSMGVNTAPKKPSSDDIARLLGSQSLAMRELRTLDPSFLESPAHYKTSLVSAGLASGQSAFRNTIQAYSAQRPADFPGLQQPQSVLADFETRLRKMEQEQRFASFSNSGAASSLLTGMQSERNLTARLSQTTGICAQGFTADALPLASCSGRHHGLHALPTASGHGLTQHGPSDDHFNSAVQHEMDLNRFVLQAPQDDATYFRQRLLPGMPSLTNTANATLPRLGGGVSLHELASQNLAAHRHQLRGSSANSGGLSDFFKRKLHESEMQVPRSLKRQRS